MQSTTCPTTRQPGGLAARGAGLRVAIATIAGALAIAGSAAPAHAFNPQPDPPGVAAEFNPQPDPPGAQ